MNIQQKAIARLPEKQKRLLLKKLLENRKKSNFLAFSPDPDNQTCYPLSHGQKGLWMTYQMAPDNYAYNTPMAWKIQGKIKKDVLRRAFERLLMRHAVLRTRISTQNQKPVNNIAANADIAFSNQDIGYMSDDKIHSFIRTRTREPFDLETGPVVRLYLFSKSKIEHILLFNFHHIIFDGGSVMTLMSDLICLYETTLYNQPDSLPPLKFSYADFVAWQNEMLTSRKGQVHRNYWRHQLQGGLPVLEMPTDRIRPPIQTYQGDVYSTEFSQELTNRIRQTAQQENTSVFALLLSVYNLLLYRYTRQEDIQVGTPIEMRSRTEFEDLIGYFVNMVVIRTVLTPDVSFKVLLKQVQATVLEALEHGDYPFTEIAKELAPHRDRSRPPLFQAAFAFQNWVKDIENAGFNKKNLSGITFDPMLSVHQEGDFDITLEAVETGNRYKLFFKYNPDLFDHTTMVRLAGHFKVLTESVLDDPDRTIMELPMLSDVERTQLLLKWNDTHMDFPQNTCIQRLFEEQADKTPNVVAVDFDGDKLTYRELNKRANQLAHHLNKLCAGPDLLVGICVDRSLEMIVGLLGILKAGGVYVPMDPEYPIDRLSFMITDAGIKVLITQQSLMADFADHAVKTLALDTDWDAISHESSQNPDIQMTSDNIAYVIYTSGSTGSPKGVLITHRSIVSHCYAVTQRYELNADDRVLQFASLSFDASLEQILPALGIGATLVLRGKSIWTPAEFHTMISDMDVTVANVPPVYFQQLVQEWSTLPEALPENRLKLVIVGGDVLLSETINLWRQTPLRSVRLLNAYGPTEATITTTVFDVHSMSDDGSNIRSVPIGRPLANKSVYVLDPSGQPLPVGLPGEIYIGGEGVARGYLNRPELTREKFIINPFDDESGSRLYRTGDLARYLPDGHIEFIGRIDNQVKIRGFRIELGEIEAAISNHPDVLETSVVIREDQCAEKQIAAYMVSNIQPDILAKKIRSYLKQKLPVYMMPSVFVSLDDLPLMPSGKVNRNALPAPSEMDIHSADNYISPRNPTEKTLCEIWSDLLELDRVGIADNFFDIGGHSLLAIRLVARVEKAFGVCLPIASLFESPTIAEFSLSVNEKKTRKAFSPLVHMRPRKENTPIFCVHPGDGNVFHFSDLVRQLGSNQPFYGLQAFGLEPGTTPLSDFKNMAANYIKQIRYVQPKGPFIIGGLCAGGTIALEIAQQLRDSGDEVKLLILFDSLAPHLYSPLDDVQFFIGFARDLEGLSNIDLFSIYCEKRYINPNSDISTICADLNSLSHKERLLNLWECAQTAGILKPDMGTEYMDRIFNVYQAIGKGLLCYKAQRYDNRILLFRAMDSMLPRKPDESTSSKGWINDSASLDLVKKFRDDPFMGWHRIGTKPIDVFDVPGNHFTMLSKPHVSVVNQKLMQYL